MPQQLELSVKLRRQYKQALAKALFILMQVFTLKTLQKLFCFVVLANKKRYDALFQEVSLSDILTLHCAKTCNHYI